MSHEMNPALQKLQEKLKQQLEQAKRTKVAINAVCEAFDQPPLYPDVNEGLGVSHSFRADEFYGRPLAGCVRKILEGKKAAGGGATSVNEIYSTLISGGYAFETKDEDNAKRALRISLRKNSTVFHKTPGGSWGLLEWYPNAKQPTKADAAEDDDEDTGGKAKKSPQEAVTERVRVQEPEERDKNGQDEGEDDEPEKLRLKVRVKRKTEEEDTDDE